MKAALAIRHVSFEDLGTLEPVLRDHGYQIGYREAGLDDLSNIDPDVDLLVVLGGPIGAYEEEAYPFLLQELSLIQRRLARDQPTLGICLGAQIMARALGAKVYPGPIKEIGWYELVLADAAKRSILKHLDGQKLLHWHGDTFDTPEGAVLLASTDAYLNQAFSWGRRGLAVQFHAEVEPGMLERWYIGHACELAAAHIQVKSLREDTRAFAPALQVRAVTLWQEWLSRL